jgi:hypothetical protein
VSNTNTNTQYAKAYFSPDGSNPTLPPRPSDAAIKAYLDSPECPLSRIVVSERNKPALDGLRTYAFNALLRPNHSCRGMNFGFYCGPGQGKSFTTKCWAETVGIPFIVVQSDALESTWQLFEMIAEEFKKQGFPLVPIGDDYTFCIPPCIVFFDEAQALSLKLRTGGLLNAMEFNDGWLQTMPMKGKQLYKIDCQHICWVAASTDPGEIYAASEAFHSRFTQHVVWHPAGAHEVAYIVQHNLPELPFEACKTVASYVLVPREAIAFAGMMKMRQRMTGCTWAEAAREVAVFNNIDEFGMKNMQVRVLTALGQGPVARTNMPTLANCKMLELERIVLPPLFDDVEGRGQLLRPTHKGFAITRQGLVELNRRSIINKGDRVTAEAIEGA